MKDSNTPKIKKVLDPSLPIWITEGEDYRLDNNFWSPASFEAVEQLKKLAVSGKVNILPLKDVIATDGIVTGVSPSEGGTFGIIEGHNIRPNYVIPVFTKFADDKEPSLQLGDILLGKDGEPGTFAVITDELLEFNADIALGGHVYRIRLAERYSQYAFFIVLFLNSKLGQALVRKLIAGGTTPTIRADDLKKMNIAIPIDKHESHWAKERLIELQSQIIKSVSNIEVSAQLLKTLGADEPKTRLPINWSGGGRSDPHGYDKV